MVKRRRKRQSKGQNACKKCLTDFGLQPIAEVQISGMPRSKFDFMFSCNDKKYILEFDGIQHFQYSQWFHRKEANFPKRQRKDVLKTVAAILNGFIVIRIAYTEEININTILAEVISTTQVKWLYLFPPSKYDWLENMSISISSLSSELSQKLTQILNGTDLTKHLLEY